MFLNQAAIFARYEHLGSRTTVHVKRNVGSCKWISFTSSVKFIGDRVRIWNYEGMSQLNDSDLCNFEFADDTLSVEVGGYDPTDVSEELHNIQMATLSKLLIFDFPMNMSDVHTLMWKPWCVLDRALFNANSIKYAAHKNHYTCPRPEYIYNSHGNLSRSFRHPTSSSLTY